MADNTVELFKTLKKTIDSLLPMLAGENFGLMRIRDERAFLAKQNEELRETLESEKRQIEELKLEKESVKEDIKSEKDKFKKWMDEKRVITEKNFALAEEDRKKAQSEVNIALEKAKEIAK